MYFYVKSPCSFTLYCWKKTQANNKPQKTQPIPIVETPWDVSALFQCYSWFWLLSKFAWHCENLRLDCITFVLMQRNLSESELKGTEDIYVVLLWSKTMGFFYKKFLRYRKQGQHYRSVLLSKNKKNHWSNKFEDQKYYAVEKCLFRSSGKSWGTRICVS